MILKIKAPYRVLFSFLLLTNFTILFFTKTIMKSTFLILLLLSAVMIFISCSEEKKDRPNTAIETGTAFIKASLNGDFSTSESLILKDSSNSALFNAYKEYYEKLPAEKKLHYKQSSYEIIKLDEINDSVTIINFSNDYMNKPMDIKIVRVKNNWFIDFKYTYSGNLPID